MVSDAEELPAGNPIEVAVENARRKAQAVARGTSVLPQPAHTRPGQDTSPATRAGSTPAAPVSPSSLPVVGVDTVVVLDGVIYGKPADAAEARSTLERLAGRTHEVVSGLAVVEDTQTRTASATTRVTFRDIDPATLDWYLATEEWRERAGGYAIQGRGAALVAGIEGDYLNVVGLPVTALLELLPGILHADS